jgi:large subunit ribosomal protein L2
MRKVRQECFASIGTVSNPDHHLITIGKAGRSRWMGRRPEVLGKSMNAVDHPHGGGEGHCPIGLRFKKTQWGKPAMGVKTRNVHKRSDTLIVRERLKKRRKK